MQRVKRMIFENTINYIEFGENYIKIIGKCKTKDFRRAKNERENKKITEFMEIK